MGNRGRARSRPEGGFSLIEMVIVVGLIVTLAAVAMPAITRYIRNYKILGAVRNVAGELRTARSQAVSKNVRAGVALVVVGPTTYRFVREDFLPGVAGRLGPLLDLPQNVTFTAGNVKGLRFSNLGASCPTNTANCADVSNAAGSLCDPAEVVALRCSDDPPPFVATPVVGDPFIAVLENDTNLTRRIQIGTGGRVYTDLQ